MLPVRLIDDAAVGRLSPRRAAVAAGRARIEVARVGGVSAVVSAAAASPLRVFCPRWGTSTPWLVTSTLGGGLVDGDVVAIDLAVAAGCTAALTTQASTKVYRGARGARSDLRATVGRGALLAVLPDPVTCFAGSRLDQRIEIDLADGASLVLLDLFTAGRVASGERWAFSRLSSDLSVRGGTAPLRDAMELDQAHGPLAERLTGVDLLATLVVVGPALADARAAIRDAIERRPPRTGDPTGCLESVVARGDGLLVRLAGRTIEAGLTRLRVHLAPVTRVVGDPSGPKR